MSDVCDRYRAWAAEAVDEWDGQDNGDLLKLLSERLGASLFELKCAIEDIMARESAAYWAEPKQEVKP